MPTRMHAPAHAPSAPPAPRTPPSGDVGPFLVADWRRVVFIHFAVPASELARHVPHPLELAGGKAFVSLVSFSLERLRPGQLVPPRLGRALLGPISRHDFLNVRTYVRGPAGAGVFFLTEWINNPVSLRLGPLTYGLPYRLASIQRVDLSAGGLAQIRVTEPGQEAGIGITVPLAESGEAAPCEPGSLDAFLVERYTAYTRRRGIDRCFHVWHRPWDLVPVDLVRTDTRLLELVYPWFRHAELVSAHVGPGLRDVVISRPHRCGITQRAALPGHASLPVMGAVPGD